MDGRGEKSQTRAKDFRIVAPDDPSAEITIYTLNWTSDHATKEGEAATGQLQSRVAINGEEVKFAYGFTVDARGGDFVTAMIHVLPAAIRFVHLDHDEFYAEELPASE